MDRALLGASVIALLAQLQYTCLGVLKQLDASATRMRRARWARGNQMAVIARPACLTLDRWMAIHPPMGEPTAAPASSHARVWEDAGMAAAAATQSKTSDIQNSAVQNSALWTSPSAPHHHLAHSA